MDVLDESRTTNAAHDLVLYLLLSPTRSSLVGVTQQSQLNDVLSLHNGELDSPGPPETALLRPWRIAKAVPCSSYAVAWDGVQQISRASGFRARLAALSDWRRSCSSTSVDPGEPEGMKLDVMSCLDSLTYALVDFANPVDPNKNLSVRALIDTGSTDCDLTQEKVSSLQLPTAKGSGFTRFETAAGISMVKATYDAIVSVLNCQAHVQLNPLDKDGEDDDTSDGSLAAGDSEKELEDVDRAFGLQSDTDDAILGHKALSRLGLLVDCRTRRLIPSVEQSLPSLKFLSSPSPHVHVEVINPSATHRRIQVLALVDTGSTDFDVSKRVIDTIGLEIDTSQRPAQFETAGGVTVEAPIYKAVVRILGREASVNVSPTENSDDDPDEDEEALLGHDVLAALGLVVDCRNRQLIAL